MYVRSLTIHLYFCAVSCESNYHQHHTALLLIKINLKILFMKEFIPYAFMYLTFFDLECDDNQ